MAKQKKESKAVIADRKRRMKWWHEARFGMFVHYGLYSQLGRHEWAMNLEHIPIKDYEKLADTFSPKPGSPREWVRLAKKAGMKYIVMTSKHHEGFCLWDTKQTDYNAVQRGPGRDIVREYVDACREAGLRFGFYYSLMDWHHPDGARCFKNENARRRFVDYTHALVRELMTNYGKIDILWYDVAWPLDSPERWESAKMNRMVRVLQPDIIINNRSQLPEDFGTPEEHIRPEATGRAWESCMTFNRAWGWRPTPPEDWHSPRKVLELLQQVTSSGGNLLLNIGPMPDGSPPPEAVERLTTVGKWLAKYGEPIYGKVDRADQLAIWPRWATMGQWTRKGRTAYYWVHYWPACPERARRAEGGTEMAIAGLKTKVKSVTLMGAGPSTASTGLGRAGSPRPRSAQAGRADKKLRFKQDKERLVVKGLPARCPDKLCHMAMLKLDFAGTPKQKLTFGYVEP